MGKYCRFQLKSPALKKQNKTPTKKPNKKPKTKPADLYTVNMASSGTWANI